MDSIDTATRDQETYTDAALANLRRRGHKADPLYIDGIRCCVDCEKPIPPRRLEIFPDAVRCVLCQEAADIKERAKG